MEARVTVYGNRPHIKSMGLIGAGGVGETNPASIPATAVGPEFLGQGQGQVIEG